GRHNRSLCESLSSGGLFRSRLLAAELPDRLELFVRDRQLPRSAPPALVRLHVSMPLDAPLELVDEAVDGSLPRRRLLADDDVRALRVDDRLRRVVLGDRRVAFP